MEVQAIAKSVRISPRKVRLVADAIRNVSVGEALAILEAADQQASRPLAKTLLSAIANATHNAKLDRANLVIGSLQISDGQVFKRFRPSTRGRIHPYKKRGSNITIVLKERTVVAKPVVKNATKVVKAEKIAEKDVEIIEGGKE